MKLLLSVFVLFSLIFLAFLGIFGYLKADADFIVLAAASIYFGLFVLAGLLVMAFLGFLLLLAYDFFRKPKVYEPKNLAPAFFLEQRAKTLEAAKKEFNPGLLLRVGKWLLSVLAEHKIWKLMDKGVR